MTEIKVEDVLIPLLKNHYDHEVNFDRKFNVTRENPKPLYLKDDFGFSINFIHIITTKELDIINENLEKSQIFNPVGIKGQHDSLDKMFTDGGKKLFDRNIFISDKELKIEIQTANDEYSVGKFSCRLYINITNTKKSNHIISVILTSSEYNINSKFCNKHIIKLVDGVQNESVKFSFPKDFPGEIKDLLKKDTFVAIQLRNRRWKSPKDNTFDAKSYVEENPYYFYSILTLDEKVFRRTYANIMDVLGWCQSASSAYFDVFYGTTCLELTIKPKPKIFDETGHDSEEFRIWELLALQKKLLDEIDKRGMENVDDLIKELDLIYNFKIFTTKIGKGEKWIRYGEYLQKITGIDSAYRDYKIKIERKNKEYEQKLQKLNIFIIVSIFASFLTLLLNPIYNSLASTDNDPSLNSTINLTIDSTNYFDFTHLFKNLNPEFEAIIIASILTFVSILSIGYVYVKISKMKIPNKIKQHQIIEKLMKLEEYSIYILIFLLIISVIYFFNW